MPIYEYKGLLKNGKNTRGIVDSENLRAARLKLKKDGIFVTEIKDKKKVDGKTKGKTVRTSSVPVEDMALMTRQLATLLKANIPLVDALSAVAEQVENPVLSEAISDAKNQVNEGVALNKAFLKYPKLFNKIYISMCEAGEASGTLDVILLRLAEFTESQSQLKQKVKSAMTYPVIMIVIIIAILSGLFIFVIPNIVTIFEGNPELTLPWYTQVVIEVSGYFVNYWYIIGGLITIVSLLFINWKNSEAGRPQWDAISLKLPIAGEVIRMVAVSRFTRTLSTLLTGGVPMLNAMDIVRNVVDNAVIADAIDMARSNISEGESIAGPLKKSGQFPPIVIHMVNIGEKTGDLENMLSMVSDAYDFQVKSKIEGMTALLTPVVTVLMGIVVFIIVIAIMVPMFQMTNLGN